MNTILVLVWIAVTVVVWMFAIVSLLQSQAILEKLRTIDATHWEAFQSMGQIILDNLVWLLLVAVIIAELVSVAFPEVRAWFGENLYLAVAIYLVPILVLSVTMIVLRFR
jgi:hypothetical protein